MSEYHDISDFIDEPEEEADYTTPNGHTKNGHVQNGQSSGGDGQKEEVVYQFSYSRKSFREAGRKALKASETALHTGLAVDDLMERRRQARRQVRRQNMSDGLRLIGLISNIFL